MHLNCLSISKKTISYQVVEKHSDVLVSFYGNVNWTGSQRVLKCSAKDHRVMLVHGFSLNSDSDVFFSDLHLIYNEIETCLFHALQLQTILNAPLDSQSIICCFFYFFRVFQLLPFSYHKKRELVFRHFRTIIHLGIHCDPIRDLAKTLQDTGLGAHSMRRFTEK